MAEVIDFHGSRMNIHDLSEQVIAGLVAQDKLPADFYFRLLQFEPDQRGRIATQTVLSKLGLARSVSPESEEYLTSVLPACAVLSAGLNGIISVISRLDEDYHTLSRLKKYEEDIGAKNGISYQMWSRYVHLASPRISAMIQAIRDREPRSGSYSKDFNYKYSLERTVIRDDVLMSVYNGSVDLPGHGEASKRLLGRLLLDNHPELVYDMDITE